VRRARIQLGLGSVLLGALCLAGLPEVLPDRLPPGALRGLVVDSSGYALPGARVFLFGGTSDRPRAETRSDASGAFDFAFVPPEPRVFVRAPEGSGRLDAFGPAASDARGPLAFVLHRARPLEVRVRRPAELTLEGLEVRVHAARGEASVVSLAHTARDGSVQLPAPARAHVAVEERSTGIFRWRFNVEVPAEGRTLELELPGAQPLSGRLEVSGTGREGLVLVLHEEGPEPQWSGLARTDAAGAFLLPRPVGACSVTVLDPLGRVLPHRTRLAAGASAELVLALEEGPRQIVRTARRGIPLATRVFLWNPLEELLGHGLRTDGSGRVELAVPPRFNLLATPLDGVHEPIEGGNHSWSPGELRLDALQEP